MGLLINKPDEWLINKENEFNLIYKIELLLLLLLLLNYCSFLTPCMDCVGTGYVDDPETTLAALVTSGGMLLIQGLNIISFDFDYLS